MFEVHREVGFYRNLKPIDGVKEAMESLAKYFTVVICGEIPDDAPAEIMKIITQEKLDWIDEHLGNKWSKTAILIPHNKTGIRGHYLIGDTLNKGNGSEVWEQILFKWPYNKNKMNGTLRVDWSEWRKIVDKIKIDIQTDKLKLLETN